jgi:hypothetical protein
MGAESAIGIAVVPQVIFVENSPLDEDDVQNHAAMPFGHQEDVRRIVVLHDLIHDYVNYLCTGKSWSNVQGVDLLGDVENSASIVTASTCVY